MLKRLKLLTLLAGLAAGSASAQMSGLAVFNAPLSPSSENPPVEGVSMAGNATVLIHMNRDSSGALTQAVVDFHINASTEAPEMVFAMHIHRGVRGANGGVVIDSNFGPELVLDAGSHNLFRQNVITDEDGLAVVEEVLASPGGFYVNVHARSNPRGIIRGQLMKTDAAAISSLQGQIEALAAANEDMAGELASMKETLARIARRLGVVPAE